jgi:hypothetical protein
MAGNFTHMMYDNDAYNEELGRSTKPLSYKLDPHYSVNCSPCFTPHGPRGGHDNAAVNNNNIIDVDSILKGLGKVSSNSNQSQVPISLAQYQLQVPSECPNMLETQYSRYSHPTFDIRGLNTKDMRLGYPLHDPQCQIFENFQVNTRLQAKDNHKKIWQVPMSQTASLPVERLNRVKKCKISVDCH